MPVNLDLDTYVIGRPDKFALNVPYDCYDKDGAKLFTIKKSFIGDSYSLIDSAGQTVGAMHRKTLAINPVFELYDGNKQLIGKAIEELTINIIGTGGEKKYLLQDPNGNKIAHLTITSPLAVLTELLKGDTTALKASYEIMSADDSKVIAKVDRQMPARTSGWVTSNTANFILQIVDKSVPTLALIEFAIAVDSLYGASGTSSTHFTPMGPGGPPKGGFGIKFG